MEGANTYTRTTTVNAEALIVKWQREDARMGA
jgi:hypothetical protein